MEDQPSITLGTDEADAGPIAAGSPPGVRISSSSFEPVPRLAVGSEPPRLDAKAIRSADFRLTPYRPDSLVDGWEAGPFQVRAASVRGDAHRYYGVPRQDDMTVAWDAEAEVLVIVVADGVSAAPYSQVGASVACRYAVECLLRQPLVDQPPDWVEVLEGCAWAMIEAGQRLRSLPRPDPVRAEQDLATTLCVARVIATETGVDVRAMSVGDSGLGVVRDNQILSLLGAKAPPVDGITDTAVVALPRIPAPPATGEWLLSANETLLVATDGLWDPIGAGTGDVARFIVDALGPDLPDQADFLRVVDLYKETHDDDRTLVAVRRRQPPKPSENPESG